MSRFFDSPAWNTRNRDAAEAVLRAAGLDPVRREVPGPRPYLTAEMADATARAAVAQAEAGESGWLVGGGRVPVRALAARPGRARA